MPDKLTSEHLVELQQAKLLLENPGLAARLTNILGSPIEKGIDILPKNAQKKIVAVTTNSLEQALRFAIYTLGNNQKLPTNRTHKASVTVTGAVGGFFGLPALAIEMPISTVIMLRSIADIAKSHGENVRAGESQAACLEIFALGGPSGSDDASESGYFIARAALAKAVSDAAKHLASKGAISEGAPALVRLVAEIAARFSIPVTEKAAAQAIPVIGAAGGAIINAIFINHFQDIAQGHFIVRRLEREYDPELVQSTYLRLPSSNPE